MWIFDGKPELVRVMVPNSGPAAGACIMVLVQESGGLVLTATRFPARSVQTYLREATLCGGSSLVRVLVTQPHPRADSVKRLLATQLALVDNGGAAQDPPLLDLVKQKATELFDALEAQRRLNAAISRG